MNWNPAYFHFVKRVFSFFLLQASSLDVTNIMRAVKADKSANSPAKVAFLEKVRQSNAACQNGDFERAVALYTEAIQLDPANHILYSNRSAAHIKMGQFAKALQDAVKAKELNPEWPKVQTLANLFYLDPKLSRRAFFFFLTNDQSTVGGITHSNSEKSIAGPYGL